MASTASFPFLKFSTVVEAHVPDLNSDSEINPTFLGRRRYFARFDVTLYSDYTAETRIVPFELQEDLTRLSCVTADGTVGPRLAMTIDGTRPSRYLVHTMSRFCVIVHGSAVDARRSTSEAKTEGRDEALIVGVACPRNETDSGLGHLVTTLLRSGPCREQTLYSGGPVTPWMVQQMGAKDRIQTRNYCLDRDMRALAGDPPISIVGWDDCVRSAMLISSAASLGVCVRPGDSSVSYTDAAETGGKLRHSIAQILADTSDIPGMRRAIDRRTAIGASCAQRAQELLGLPWGTGELHQAQELFTGLVTRSCVVGNDREARLEEDWLDRVWVVGRGLR